MIVTVLLRVLLFALGASLVVGTVVSAVRTFVLPRSARTLIPVLVFRAIRLLFLLRMKRVQTYEQRDQVMAIYAPLSLLALPVAWLSLTLIGYTAMYRAWSVTPWSTAFKVSGSSLLTLGFATAGGVPSTLLVLSEATIGLILVALLISYLPAMYAAFSRREEAVTMLEVRAGSPPSAVEMFKRFQRLKRLELLHDLWLSWEIWFVDLEESHTSFAALTFFRSPQPDHSWVTAAGAVLDAAALANALLDVPRDPQADLCIRAGYIALQRIAAFFRIPFNPLPAADDPISVTREEFDAACDDLAAGGVPLKPDRDQAWRDFCGWRVNYDAVLLALADLTMAPYAPWSSDRGTRVKLPLFARGG